MKNIIRSLLIILIVVMAATFKTVSINEYDLNFLGLWKVEEVSENQYISNSSIIYDNQVIKLDKKKAIIFDSIMDNVKYKLKVVDKNYVLSYENDLYISDFYNGDEKEIDIISVIYQDRIIAEFFITSMNEMILNYKSEIYLLGRISNQDNQYTEEFLEEMARKNHNGEVLDEGVMIGLKTPRKKDEEGNYSNEYYRTIWIPYENQKIGDIYEKENIIFPRLNGIWQMKMMDTNEAEMHYNQIIIEQLNGKNETNIKTNVKVDEYESITFIGNDYIGIEAYYGKNFNNEYDSYKIVPVDNVNSEEGLQISDILGEKYKARYKEEYDKSIKNAVKDQGNKKVNDIYYGNITLKRSVGIWVLAAKAAQGEEDIIFSLPMDNKLINFNALYVPWKSLKGDLVFFKDALTSPEAQIAIVQFRNNLSIYKIEKGMVTGSPISTIPIEDDEEIIMAEWCSSSYVKEWGKYFVNGNEIQ